MDKKKKSDKEKKSHFSKYALITILIVLFVVVEGAVLLLNYILSEKIAQDTAAVNAAARQSVLAQQLAREVMDLDIYVLEESEKKAKTPAVMIETVNEEPPIVVPEKNQNNIWTVDALKRLADSAERLKTYSKEFTESLDTFEQGGTLKIGDNNVRIDAVQSADAIAAVKDAKTLWAPYKRLVDSFLTAYEQSQVSKQGIKFTVDYGREYNETLFFHTNKLVGSLEGNAQRKTNLLKILQVAGLFFAVIMFFLIVFLAMRRLQKTDAQLEVAQEETNQIMRTVHEGLFLVDSDLQVSSQYSAELVNILGTDNIGNRSLLDLLSNMLSEHDNVVLQTFVKQLYNDRVLENLIADLNPLQRVEIKTRDESGAEVSRYLDFKFSRVYDGTKIDRIMGSVTDVSHAVKLEELLQQEREQNESQANLLNLVLQADRSIMQDFVRKSDHRLDSINSILREPGKSSHDMQDKAQRIAREIHSLKGEASALKLRNYVTTCEQFEDIVKPLRDREDLTYENFLPLTIKLDEIVSTNRMLAGIMEKLSQYANAGASLATPSATAVASNGETLTGDDAMRKYYTSFAHDIAERNGKKVSLNVKGLGTVPLSTEQRDLVQEIAVQLLRNSIVHGIEESKLREAIGKNKIGQIQLLLQRNKDGTATLTVEDDGSGIKYEKIREKALKSGKYSAAEVAAWDNQKLLKLMFSSGFSTADKQSEDAGRGVGMDIIKDRINQLKGKMQIGSKRNVFTRFSINFPLKK